MLRFKGFPKWMHYSPISLLTAFTITFLAQSVLCSFEAGYPPINQHGQIPLEQNVHDISFSEEWQVLGPFRSGTRGKYIFTLLASLAKAVWGADPLESQGGFRNLSYDEKAVFNSALATNGTVKWDLTSANISTSSGQTKAKLTVNFPSIKWGFLQSVYGWSALQYQAWARGVLKVTGPDGQSVALFASGLLEFSVDGHRYFGGDFYKYRKAPVVVHLSPGDHVVDLRLIRDVRALGATGEPTIEVSIEAEARHEPLSLDETTLLASEISKGELASPWATIQVQNNAACDIEILSIKTTNAHQHFLSLHNTIHLFPYQARPLVFNITLGTPLQTEFSAEVVYRAHTNSQETLKTNSFQIKLTERSLTEPQKFTFIHPASIVSYAILCPPLNSACATSKRNGSIPIIIGLHGAGLEADSVQVREMLAGAHDICAWILLPTGVTPWSSDDWHNWGTADVRAAVAAIPHWIDNVGWGGPQALQNDWIVVGHSNGGQGTWFLSTHYPDNIIAAAPVSGYSSIENYVPYSMWHEAEPLISYILQTSRNSFKHELLLENLAGIPILQQHGSEDDNVPAYHSRLMHELLGQSQWPSAYNELPGKGHWFEGVLTTPSLLNFYEENTYSLSLVDAPLTFIINIPTSGDMGPKNGIAVDQLQSPDTNGQMKVTRNPERGIWYVRSRNIHRFHLFPSPRIDLPVTLVLDDKEIPFEVSPDRCGDTWYLKDNSGRWISSHEDRWQSIQQRYGRQLGGMDAILRSNGTFLIDTCSDYIEHIALQISRNFLQYFSADSQIIGRCKSKPTSFDNEPAYPNTGNVISLAIGDDLPPSQLIKFPIYSDHGRLVLSKGCNDKHRVSRMDPRAFPMQECREHLYSYEAGLGALFLRPLDDERLELVVWGADVPGLEQAARLVPTITGVGQPEFLVLSDNCRWKGHSGLYAAGSFDKFWQISPASFISQDSRVSRISSQ